VRVNGAYILALSLCSRACVRACRLVAGDPGIRGDRHSSDHCRPHPHYRRRLHQERHEDPQAHRVDMLLLRL